MRITWFGHSTFRLDFGSAHVLIDPFFSGNPAFEGDRQAATAGATHILITHGHGDHVGDTVEIAAETGAKVVTNYDLCMWLSSKGVTKLEPMNTGGTVDVGGFRVSLVRADHSAGMSEAGVTVPLGLPNGVIVRAEGEPTVYHMGDTDIFGDMALIQEIYRPDVLMVPIGDRFTMGAETAALAVKRFFKPKAVIPCHYGSFPIVDQSAERFVSALDGSGVQVIVPHKGTAVTV
ncbi:metal-dependent hydrolase [Methylobacterium sp. SyP6R]|uniref:metal-dependent hydrolase n=1 Tax=Methylobacterium sp. SyP6R TaxID=2718876 RepID=UPI001F37716F|nr:metal-dependent hydrolase [Methylobacterium sp. SyP6R]MCF4129064.1 metal-dependent hydrolase [Methylobacterium sp. SyP6R]